MLGRQSGREEASMFRIRRAQRCDHQSVFVGLETGAAFAMALRMSGALTPNWRCTGAWLRLWRRPTGSYRESSSLSWCAAGVVKAGARW